MTETKKSNTVLVNAMVNALKDADIRIKGTSLESICAAHLHNDLRHNLLTSLYGCRPGQATRILSILNELVPRSNNKGETEMTAKKKTSATAKLAAKKTAQKAAASKKATPKKVAPKKTAPKKVASKKTAPKQSTRRPQQNGVGYPGEKAQPYQVWQDLDALAKKLGRAPTREEALDKIKCKDGRDQYLGSHYRRWATYHGHRVVTPRGTKKTATTKPAKKTGRKLPVKKAIKRRPAAKKVHK